MLFSSNELKNSKNMLGILANLSSLGWMGFLKYMFCYRLPNGKVGHTVGTCNLKKKTFTNRQFDKIKHKTYSE